MPKASSFGYKASSNGASISLGKKHTGSRGGVKEKKGAVVRDRMLYNDSNDTQHHQTTKYETQSNKNSKVYHQSGKKANNS